MTRPQDPVTDDCPVCDNPLELEQRGTRFFCAHCGSEFEADAQTLVDTLPVQAPPVPGPALRQALPYLLVLGVTCWLLLAFATFHVLIVAQELRYDRGQTRWEDRVGRVLAQKRRDKEALDWAVTVAFAKGVLFVASTATLAELDPFSH